MAKQSGKDTFVSFGGTDISTVLRDFNVSRVQNEAESTAGADEFENTVATTKAITATATFVMLKDADGGSTIRAALEEGTEASLLWGWEGNSTGKKKGGITARVSKFDIKSNYKNVIMADVAWSNVGTALLFDDTTDTW